VARLPRPDRQILLVLLVSAAVLLPRAALIARAHSETYDEEYHLSRGARYWSQTLAGVPLNDPPLGEALAAAPLSLLGRGTRWSGTLYDHPLSPESALFVSHLWMSVLFLPVIGVAFAWCRRLYGSPSAWLAAALLLAEPTFAAHAPLCTLDVLGAGGALAGSFLAWRFFERPSWPRLLGASAGVACALMLKHTTLALPAVAAAYGALAWIVAPMRRREGWPAWRAALPPRLLSVAAALLAGALTIWALTLFDVSRPHPQDDWGRPTAVPGWLDRPLPGGLYLTALLQGLEHAGQGHFGYLLGETRLTGWWYYFPVVLFYKMPLGIAVVLALGAASFAWRRPRFEEWGLVVPLLAFTGLSLASRVNIGLRHFLPAYLFLLLLGARCLARADARAPAWARASAWGGAAAAALHAATFHPDYLSYLNVRRERPWMSISDSNLDWGQGLKQARAWLDTHRNPPDRPVHLLYFGDDASGRRVRHYLGDDVTYALRPGPLPGRGLLIASPVWVAGPYDPGGAYASLRDRRPYAVIGHSLLVYDLDHSGAENVDPSARVESRAIN
jgi:hypothetical protein